MRTDPMPYLRSISEYLTGRASALGISLSLCIAMDVAVADTAAGVEAFESGNFDKAYEELRPEAEAGDPEAQYYLGGMYLQGSHVEQDLERARHWLRSASEQSHAAAKLELGYLYSNGIGVATDNEKAASLYRAAAEAGNSMAQRNLGLMYEEGEGVERDYELAVTWFHRAAVQDDDVAAYKLGELFYYGRGSLELDYRMAHRWFGRAALAGNADAQYAIGGLYLQGLGVPNNNVVAYTWRLFAARQGHRVAQRSWENAHWFINEREKELIRARVERGEMPAVR
ncbi:tetratricopeptide repeat protein [Aquisalimonas lutea]|uniref:tetratricopeptide repeat protein n=1 Tax=Aquisalimonas lutea TaxID=1327750 RepID=UPI0025B6052D|nr:tetratricopeptide repeat protein [Aquisalimonas lutea]MDN3518671.1 tetratricopeptide repeat protein [Aquisalimonas lutea]